MTHRFLSTLAVALLWARYARMYADLREASLAGANWASSAPPALERGCEGEWWKRGGESYPPTQDHSYASFVRWFTARASEISLARQAVFTTLAIELATKMSFVRSAVVYALRDDGAEASDWEDNLGLLTPRGTPKPAFFAFAAAAGGPALAAPGSGHVP